MAESWQSYANLVGGLTSSVRDRAVAANGELLENLIVAEVDKSAMRKAAETAAAER